MSIVGITVVQDRGRFDTYGVSKRIQNDPRRKASDR